MRKCIYNKKKGKECIKVMSKNDKLIFVNTKDIKYCLNRLEDMDYYYLPNYNMAAEKERQKVVRKLNAVLRKGLKDAKKEEKWLESIERNNNI
jgi:hypothetical protein